MVKIECKSVAIGNYSGYETNETVGIGNHAGRQIKDNIQLQSDQLLVTKIRKSFIGFWI